MATAPTTRRSPEQLAEDLSQLITLDWSAVWPGEDITDPDRWARVVGWTLTRLGDENLAVDVTPGSTFTLFREPGSYRISQAHQMLWQHRSGRAADNPVVIDQALSVWPLYLAAAQQILGPAPALADDGGAVPALPHWPANPQTRATQRNPLRAGVWPQPELGIVIALWAGLAGSTTAGKWPGSASVRLAVTPQRRER